MHRIVQITFKMRQSNYKHINLIFLLMNESLTFHSFIVLFNLFKDILA